MMRTTTRHLYNRKGSAHRWVHQDRGHRAQRMTADVTTWEDWSGEHGAMMRQTTTAAAWRRCEVQRRNIGEEEAPPRNKPLCAERRAEQGGAGAAADVDESSTEGVVGVDEDEDEVRTSSSRWGG